MVGSSNLGKPLREKELDEQHPSSLQSIMVNAEIEIQQNDMNLIMVEDGLCQMQYENGRKDEAAKESFAHNSCEEVGGSTLYIFPFVWPSKAKVNLHCDEQMLYGNDQSCELFGEFRFYSYRRMHIVISSRDQTFCEGELAYIAGYQYHNTPLISIRSCVVCVIPR